MAPDLIHDLALLQVSKWQREAIMSKINLTDTKPTMPITKDIIENGFRFEYNGIVVSVTNDERFFTILEWHNTHYIPVGTIVRPRIPETKWSAYLLDGTVVTLTAVGPRGAFARFIGAYQKTNNGT